jgi:2-hydroxy-3-keto-5-methylthiopentenyl-1-phosphate phosphatase
MSLTFIVLFAFAHFVFQLAIIRLVVQPCKCLVWLPSSLHPNFSPLIHFCCPLNDIKVLGVPFGMASFISSFLQNVLNKNVHHVNALSKLK